MEATRDLWYANGPLVCDVIGDSHKGKEWQTMDHGGKSS